jgi:hypothetical protein
MLNVAAIVLILGAWMEPVPRAEDGAASQSQTIAWSSLGGAQQSQVMIMFEAPDWPVRVFGMLRLERYTGPDVDDLVRERLKDKAWQVRCFAIRAVRLRGLEMDPELLKDEKEPRVIRATLRNGVKLPVEDVQKVATKYLRARNIEDLVLGLELAAASDLEPLRADATRRIEALIANIDDLAAALMSRRLAALLRLDEVPQTAAQWKVWFTAHQQKVTLPSPDAWLKEPAPAASLVADMDDETFTRLQDYLDFLRQRDLDLVIVMDATASMIPMVNQARAGVDALILFLSDISHEMRLAFVAYRDHDNKPVWDGHPFTTDIASIRKYLFDLRVTGGADYPEAVLEGLEACGELTWNKKATRQIVLVGDAPPHEEDMYRVRALLESMRDGGVTVHAVHVPMEPHPRVAATSTTDDARKVSTWMEQYNTSTGEIFTSIAELGGGQKTEMTNARDLVPAIMHFTIEDGWWPVFDEFYARYLELCR